MTFYLKLSFIQARTFKTSAFYAHYPTAEIPKFQHHVFYCLEAIITWYCKRKGIDPSAGDMFFKSLQQEAFEYKHELLNEVPAACQRLWTSAKTFTDKREFCSILNEAIRIDDEAVMKDLAKFVRGMNELCVTRSSASSGGKKVEVEWPKDHKLYRGGGLPNVHQGVCVCKYLYLHFHSYFFVTPI